MPNARTTSVAALMTAAFALVGAGVLAPTSTGAMRSIASKGSVTPRVGGPATTFIVTYTTPIATGIKGKSVVFQEVQVTNTNSATFHKTSCTSRFAIDPTYGSAARAQIRTGLHPRSPWCAGSYHIQVLELKTLLCSIQRKCPGAAIDKTGLFELGPQFRVT